MTDFPPPTPPTPPSEGAGEPAYPALPPYPGPADMAPALLPFSKLAIFGFAIACVSLFVLGWLGLVGAILSARGLRDIRHGLVRGRGLAIAGFVVGAVAFVAYAIIFLTRTS